MAVDLTPAQNPLGLSALELAGGRALGGTTRPLPSHEAAGGPRAALERCVLEALAAGPVVVALSGGRDSSAVLALAAHVARREGLAPPAAVSYAFPGLAGDETEWQELLIRELGIDGWERIEIHDELDFVGPIAAPVLERHGLLYPANAHLYAPVLERARGGVVLTGIGGDEMLEGWRFFRAIEALRRGRRPSVADLRSLALLPAPARLREAGLLRLSNESRPWLTPRAERDFLRERARASATVPRTYPAFLAWASGRRTLALTAASLDLIASAAGARIVHPLMDRHWLAALARAAGPLGHGGRERVWPLLFGDLLPEALRRRADKSGYHGVYFAGPSLEFTRNWRGEGLAGDVVDPAGLRTVWEEGWRVADTGELQQALWLARGV